MGLLGLPCSMSVGLETTILVWLVMFHSRRNSRPRKALQCGNERQVGKPDTTVPFCSLSLCFCLPLASLPLCLSHALCRPLSSFSSLFLFLFLVSLPLSCLSCLSFLSCLSGLFVSLVSCLSCLFPSLSNLCQDERKKASNMLQKILH